jgi:hypothetical protein
MKDLENLELQSYMKVIDQEKDELLKLSYKIRHTIHFFLLRFAAFIVCEMSESQFQFF